MKTIKKLVCITLCLATIVGLMPATSASALVSRGIVNRDDNDTNSSESISSIGQPLNPDPIVGEEYREQEVDLSAYYNLSATKANAFNDANAFLSNNAWIALHINITAPEEISGSGKVYENRSLLFEFEFNGFYSKNEVEKKSIGIKGSSVSTMYVEATGTIVDNEEPVSMTAYHIPETEYTFVFLSVGAVAENRLTNSYDLDDTYIFGYTFGEMSETTIEVNADRGISIEEPLVIDEDEIMNAAIDNYTFGSMDTVAGEFASGKAQFKTNWRASAISTVPIDLIHRIPIVAVSVYTPLKSEPNKIYTASVKVNASLANLRKWIQARFNYTYQLYTSWFDSGSCTLYAPKEYAVSEALSFMNPDPVNQSWHISFQVPGSFFKGSLGYIFDWIDVSFNLLFAKIKMKLTKYAGKRCYNKCEWDHNYKADVSWGSNPMTADKGYSGQVMYTMLDNEAKYFYICAKGSMHYWYTSNFQNAIYNGGGTLSTAVIRVPIYVGYDN